MEKYTGSKFMGKQEMEPIKPGTKKVSGQFYYITYHVKLSSEFNGTIHWNNVQDRKQTSNRLLAECVLYSQRKRRG